MKYQITEFDFIFLSFDEPNAEQLYAELLNIAPWSKRIHGIKGFDAAHIACSDVSDTDFFITIDGDTSVDPKFLMEEVEILDDQKAHAWTWSSKNYVNGLIYGNGGLKLWSKNFVLNMNSHERATDHANSVDFCWNPCYHDFGKCFSTNMINSSPYQAWRSGFREGVKMCLDRGNRVSVSEFNSKIWHGNRSRLSIWASVGQDVDNGIWSIYGARMGCYHTMFTNEPYDIINDYVKMNNLWQTVMENDPIAESLKFSDKIRSGIGLDISLLSPIDSKFFKSVYVNPTRQYFADLYSTQSR